MSKTQIHGAAGLEVSSREGANAPMVDDFYNDKVFPHEPSATTNDWRNGSWQDATVSPAKTHHRAMGKMGRLPRTTVCLSIALAVAILLGAVGIGVAAGFAVKHGKNGKNGSNSTCSPASQTGRNFSSPSSDCENLGSTYRTSVQAMDQSFDISCKNDFAGNDMIGILLPTFEDCMKACASYNFNKDSHNASSCGAISLDNRPIAATYANCWLKSGEGNLSPTLRDFVDSAKVKGQS